MVVTGLITDCLDYTLAGVHVTAGRCTDNVTHALEQGLRADGITARVTRLTGPCISLATTADVEKLAGLVWDGLSDAHRAAYRLRTILRELDSRRGGLGDFMRPHVTTDGISIGGLTVPQALLLVRLLGGTPPRPPRARCSCRYLERVTRVLRGRLRTAVPAIAVTARPACTSEYDRRHLISVGTAPLSGIRALNERIETAAEQLARGRTSGRPEAP